MEFDFSKNKSCDSISADKEKKSSSFESIKRTLRHRTSSKSSGNGKSFVLDSIKRDKKKSESELSNKSLELEMGRYCEVEINPSPRRKVSESYEGYLPMKPAITTMQSLTSSDYLDMSSRESFMGRQHPFASAYLDMSRVSAADRLGGSSCSMGSNDGYVDMSECKGLVPHPICSSNTSSSSSCSQGSSFSNGAKGRKFSPTFSVLSSHDDQYMSIDLRCNVDASSSSTGTEGDKYKKKEKKSMRRRSLKDASRRKKSDPISVIGRSNEEGHEVSKKGTSPLSSLSLSTLLGRKTCTGTPPQKTPLSPTGSPLPKSNRGTPSPFSSLTRNKNRDDKESRKDSLSKDSGMTSSLSSLGTSCIEEASREAEESAMSAILGDPSGNTQTSQVPNDLAGKTQSAGSKRTSGVFEAAQANNRQEESQAGSDTGTHQQDSSDHGAYVNLTPGSCDKSAAPAEKQRKLSNVSASSDYMNISPVNSTSKGSEGESREYVNMCPGGRHESVYTNTLSPNPPQPSVSPRLPSPSGISSKQDSDKGSSSQQENCSPSSGVSSKQEDSGQQRTPRQQKRRESRRFSRQEDSCQTGEGGENQYMLMTPGQPSPPKPLSPQTVARRPNIPPSLLSATHDPPTSVTTDPNTTSPTATSASASPTPTTTTADPSLTATLEKLNLGGSSFNERCRSHSGPGAPEGSAVGGEGRVRKQLSEPRVGGGSQGGSGRAASACSSPVSYSPPTSPTLGGSVSSVSSLSEGGMSSASSTCTVVNMGVGARREGATTTRPQEPPPDTTAHSTVAPASSQPPSANTSGSGSDGGLNYVSLDLGPAKTPGIRSSPRPNRRSTSTPPITTTTVTAATTATPQDSAGEEDDEPLSYAQIDFTKSEGLRTTSLSRDHRH